VFLFDEAGNANADTLTDFQVGIDKIALDNDRFGKLGATIGELNPENFWSGAEAHAASDRVIYDTVSGKLYYDPDGTGEKAQVLIATLSDSPDDVSAADFKVI